MPLLVFFFSFFLFHSFFAEMVQRQCWFWTKQTFYQDTIALMRSAAIFQYVWTEISLNGHANVYAVSWLICILEKYLEEQPQFWPWSVHILFLVFSRFLSVEVLPFSTSSFNFCQMLIEWTSCFVLMMGTSCYPNKGWYWCGVVRIFFRYQSVMSLLWWPLIICAFWQGVSCCAISCKTKEGMEQFLDIITELVKKL